VAWCNSGLEACVQLVREAVQQYSWIFVGTRSPYHDKAGGIDPETATALFRDPGIDYVIVEADGASGRPVKVPAEHEPVIPDSVTLTIAILGLEAVDQALGPGIVFRLEQVQELTGLQPGEPLTVKILAKLFDKDRGLFRGTPEGARKMAFLNKLDLLRDPDLAHRLAASILKESDAGIERVVFGSLTQNTYRTLKGRS
jgi:probable selenium-dependent hydroxylase accessory protein YqeC